MALANLRSRLQAQYGEQASLRLLARDAGAGAEAVLELPYMRCAAASSQAAA